MWVAAALVPSAMAFTACARVLVDEDGEDTEEPDAAGTRADAAGGVADAAEALDASPSARCPPGETQLDDSCYWLDENVTDGIVAAWETARTNCDIQGATLAVVRAEAEATLIAALIEEDELAGAWIGGHQLDPNCEPNCFSWIAPDGVPEDEIGSAGWDDGQPDNFTGGAVDEDCVTLRPNGKYNDVTCDSRLRWVCERAL